LKRIEKAFLLRSEETHREQDQIGFDREFRSRHLDHLHLPSADFCHSSRVAINRSTVHWSPRSAWLRPDQSRSQPSSCDDDVRSLIGQYGQTSGLFSRSGAAAAARIA
jgi:hypothetical protein